MKSALEKREDKGGLSSMSRNLGNKDKKVNTDEPLFDNSLAIALK